MAENPPAPAAPRDIQGIIAVGVVGGAFAIAAVAIATGTAAATVLSSVLPLASVVIGYYFGQKSQQ
jgi:drug/metabolite transporter (DMT)-like permease